MAIHLDTTGPAAPASASTGVPESETNGVNGSHENGGTKEESVEPEGAEEHPDAEKIRRQVEFYFSDENLTTDLHLLQCCGGRGNIPVSISRICGFKKMRDFKPRRIVVAALRKSAFLEVTPDGKGVKRKVPLVGKCLLDPDFKAQEDDNEIAYDPRSRRAVLHPVPLIPQVKKEYPPGMTKNMMKPTGFEDTYVEAPLAPTEAQEEMAMYDPDKFFTERIEIAIQRFKQKRRMHEMYSKIFNKWMKFGGVESEPRMFGALSKQEMAEMDAEQIAKATAVHNVPNDRMDKNHWFVDFLGVGEAFLSSFYPVHYGHAPSQVKIACQVLRSFYNYLLFHQVCDEYRDQLLVCRDLCDKAELELPKTYNAGNALPGAFNVAASTIFGGSHAGLYTGNAEWAEDLDEQVAKSTEGIGMRNEKAMVTFKTGIAIHGTDAQYGLIDSNNGKLSNIKIIKSVAMGLGIVAINYSTTDVQEAYALQNETWKRKLSLQPLGKMICKPWATDDFLEYDLPKDKYPDGKLPKETKDQEVEFWVEDDVLKECFVGMKMEATVATLEGGIIILDEIKETMCSFFRWLPNELWVDRKPNTFRKLPIRGLEDFNEREQEFGRQTQENGDVEKEQNGENEVADGDFDDDF